MYGAKMRKVTVYNLVAWNLSINRVEYTDTNEMVLSIYNLFSLTSLFHRIQQWKVKPKSNQRLKAEIVLSALKYGFVG